MALSDVMAGFMANMPGPGASPDALRDHALQLARNILPSNVAAKLPPFTVAPSVTPEMPDLSSLGTSPSTPPTFEPQFRHGGGLDGLGQHRARAAFAERYPNGFPAAPTAGPWADRANHLRAMF